MCFLAFLLLLLLSVCRCSGRSLGIVAVFAVITKLAASLSEECAKGLLLFGIGERLLGAALILAFGAATSFVSAGVWAILSLWA